MRNPLFLCAAMTCVFFVQSPQASAQAPDKDAKASETKPPDKCDAAATKEESSVTDHTIRIGAQTIPYKATASTTLLKNDKGDPTGLLYSVAYTRSDVKDLSVRPVSFLYNGGPGSATMWLHMGAFGPRRAHTVDGVFTPPAPYKLVDNTESLLDKTDLVFIDAMGTGYSHAVCKAQDKDFYGIDEDVEAFAQFIVTYLSRNDRWNSPKFLIGESYGTFRSAALGNYLQNHDTVHLNGIVLISSVLDLATLTFAPGDDRPYIFYLPSYAAVAWYHKVLKDRPADLPGFIEEARKYAQGEYAAALYKGAELSAGEKAAVAKKLSYFTGLSEDYLIKADLRVTLSQFRVELQRSAGLTTGRIDARFTGYTYDLLEENAQGDPEGPAVGGAFTALINAYNHNELKFGGDKIYHNTNGARRNLELDAPAKRPTPLLSRRSECRRRPGPSHDHQSTAAGTGRKRVLRFRDAVLRHGIHHGTPGPARSPPEKHQRGLLLRGPHDVPPRRGPRKPAQPHSRVYRPRHQTVIKLR